MTRRPADEGIDQYFQMILKGGEKLMKLIKMGRTRPGNYTISVEAHTGWAIKANIHGLKRRTKRTKTRCA